MASSAPNNKQNSGSVANLRPLEGSEDIQWMAEVSEAWDVAFNNDELAGRFNNRQDALDFVHELLDAGATSVIVHRSIITKP